MNRDQHSICFDNDYYVLICYSITQEFNSILYRTAFFTYILYYIFFTYILLIKVEDLFHHLKSVVLWFIVRYKTADCFCHQRRDNTKLREINLYP